MKKDYLQGSPSPLFLFLAYPNICYLSMVRGLDTCAVADRVHCVPLPRLLFFGAKTDRSCPLWCIQEIKVHTRTCPYGTNWAMLVFRSGHVHLGIPWWFSDSRLSMPCYARRSASVSRAVRPLMPLPTSSSHFSGGLPRVQGVRTGQPPWRVRLSEFARQISSHGQGGDTEPCPVMPVRLGSCRPGRMPGHARSRSIIICSCCPDIPAIHLRSGFRH